MKEIIILTIVLMLGLIAIHYRKRLFEEQDMRELEYFYMLQIIKKKDELIKKLKGK